jgi:hypothetical protein
MLRPVLCIDCVRRFWTAFRRGVVRCDACETAKTVPVVGHQGCAHGA